MTGEGVDWSRVAVKAAGFICAVNAISLPSPLHKTETLPFNTPR